MGLQYNPQHCPPQMHLHRYFAQAGQFRNIEGLISMRKHHRMHFKARSVSPNATRLNRVRFYIAVDDQHLLSASLNFGQQILKFANFVAAINI